MQTNGASDKPLPDQFYVPYSRSVENIYNAALFAMTDLKQAGRLELVAPFAEVIAALAKVDTAALKALDDAHEAGK